jgi:hypothetical protein
MIPGEQALAPYPCVHAPANCQELSGRSPVR